MDQTWVEKLKEYLIKQHSPITQSSESLQGLDDLERGPVASTGTPTGYAYGGVIDENTSGPDFLKAMQSQDLTAEQPPIQFNPQAGMPPKAPQMPLQAPNPVNQYLDTQKAQLNKYGPEEQLALSQNLIKQRQSLPQKGAVALGGLADTLSRVGGSNSNFMGSIQDQQNRLAGEQTSALEKAGTQNIARTEANAKLDAQDPRSPLSQAAQKAWAGVLAQTGLKPDQITGMSAANIAAITGQSVEVVKAKAEAEMARATLGLKTQEAAQTAKHQTAEEEIAKGTQSMREAEDRQKQLKDLTSPTNAVLHPINAWKASKELASIADQQPDNSEHEKAVTWANANPNDPRAQRILKLHGQL